MQQERAWGVLGCLEQRARVAATRVRIPDAVLVRAGTQKQVLTEPPVVLAHDIHLRDGHVDVTVPDVITGDDYSLVCE